MRFEPLYQSLSPSLFEKLLRQTQTLGEVTEIFELSEVFVIFKNSQKYLCLKKEDMNQLCDLILSFFRLKLSVDSCKDTKLLKYLVYLERKD